MKVLITGASGFLGRNLVEGLQLFYQLLTPTHKELDLTDMPAVKKYLDLHEPDVIVHCANAGDRPGNSEVDLRMFLNLASNQYKMIYVGSGAEYGKQRPIVNIKESSFGEVVPSDSYGFGKYLISRFIWESDNYQTIHLRPFGIFGKYEDISRRFISHVINKSLNGEPITIYQDLKFSYLYVKDFVKIVEYFIENEIDSFLMEFNVGGCEVTLREIAGKVNRLYKRVPIKVLQKGMGNEYTCDDSKLRKETGIVYTPFDEALRKMHTYYYNLKLENGDKKTRG